MRLHYLACVLIVTLLARSLVASAVLATPAPPPAPPIQPATGPGGSGGMFAQVVMTEAADAAAEYAVFSPAEPIPGSVPPAALPVVLFLGGCCMADQTSAVVDFYQAWIDHLVRRGTIVLYPRYRLELARSDLLAVLRDASTRNWEGVTAPPDWSHLTVVGHSYGGVLALEYAASAAELGLPVPAALMLAMPGCTGCTLPTKLERIPASTWVLILVGDADMVVGSMDARTLWARLTHIPVDRRDFVLVASDNHGAPPLIADHGLVTTATAEGVPSVDALDWFGSWKLTDALIACTVADQDCDVVLGNTEAQRYLGTWSDGVPVIELHVTDDP